MDIQSLIDEVIMTAAVAALAIVEEEVDGFRESDDWAVARTRIFDKVAALRRLAARKLEAIHADA